MIIPYSTYITYFSQLIWPLARISGLFLTMPVVSSALIPLRVKLIFALALALIIMPFVSGQLSLIHFKPNFLLYLVNEILLGIFMGFILQLVFQIYIMAGQIIALQTGLGFATMVDPASKASVPLVSQFYFLMISLLFLALNGHLVLFELLINSFKLKPIGVFKITQNEFATLLNFSGWMFKQSVLVSLPAIFSLLIVNFAFAIMTKAAPQLNIFSIGFPMTLLLGIVIIGLTLSGVVEQFRTILDEGLLYLQKMVGS